MCVFAGEWGGRGGCMYELVYFEINVKKLFDNVCVYTLCVCVCVRCRK